MPWLDGGWKWTVLAAGLFFMSFGGHGFLFVLYALMFIGGGFMIMYSSGQNTSTQGLTEEVTSLARPIPGITKVKANMENTTKIRNFDKRMTGASVIDDVLQEVLQYTIRDYIKTWYRQISEHDGFLLDIHHFVQKVVITFSSRSKEIDWMPYFTQRLVDDFASHIRLFRRASEKIAALPKEEREKADIVETFFDLEVDMENNMCRDEICLSPDAERQYLQDLVEVILFLLLPKEDFYNKPFRYIIREVVVNGIFMPTIDLLSDPDYINQYIAWMCENSSFTKETFLTVIKSSDCLDELDAVHDMVEQEITRWRAKDSGGTDDALIKQNLNSLRFLKDTCDVRKKRLQYGPPELDQINEEPDFLKYQNLYVLTLDDIIGNNIALQTFIEFLNEKGGQQYLYFYLNVEGFRAAAEQQISEAHRLKNDSRISIEPDLESLRRAATIIFDQYLSDKASSKIKVESDLSRLTIQNIRSKMLSEDVFDSVQARVYQILHNNYYEEFLQTSLYIRLLSELGLLPDSKSDDGDTLSIDDVPRIMWFKADEPIDVSSESSPDTRSLDSLSSTSSGGTPSGDLCVTAHISQSGIVKEAGKSYAIFAITVKKKILGSDEEDICDVYRRYSDFHDLNMLLIEKFPELVGPRLPGKTVIKNTSKEFLDKRRRALDRYLKAIMKPDMWQKFQGMEDLVMRFLAPGLWEKHKSDLARKMDTIVNPLRSSMKTVGHAVKGIDGIIRNNDYKADLSMPISGKVSAGLHGSDTEENIPLRIMLLMMNEVFDLRHKNQWLRRRIVAILRQLLKATFGDMINRKIVDHVDWMTSAEQMAEYVKAFRDSFWPMGILAEPRPERDLHTVMRTRVLCKAKMLGSISDEMRHLMGTDTIQTGVDRVFKMSQHKHLNKRLIYVCLEGVLETLFPTNKFHALFRKLHSKSKRVKEGGREKMDTFCDSRTRPTRR
ncbi:sorting nexin-13-like isoform X2 [Gigantopelta aegis]|uniref:sorting nexin-13-like isoform X2 n=1 Tax=Gigantopelta aegis TaxID=1735272 RepID=UPI001B88DD2A|nr:sorting nexin-13-like isoform X2 [Gigantopelta aegis]